MMGGDITEAKCSHRLHMCGCVGERQSMLCVWEREKKRERLQCVRGEQ